MDETKPFTSIPEIRTLALLEFAETAFSAFSRRGTALPSASAVVPGRLPWNVEPLRPP